MDTEGYSVQGVVKLLIVGYMGQICPSQ